MRRLISNSARTMRAWWDYMALRRAWTHDADTGEWHNGDWRIDHVTSGLSCDPRGNWTGYRVSSDAIWHPPLFPTLRAAIEAVARAEGQQVRRPGFLTDMAEYEHNLTQQPDFVFRSRQSLRETATASARASIPDWLDDDDADANDRHWRGK